MPVLPIPAERGTYALVCICGTDTTIQAGRLGPVALRRGYYVYVGSAFGPGGLRARLEHHLRIARSPHWHIDYLRARAPVGRIWYCLGQLQREHQWAAAMGGTPVARFGSSDCACESHLFWFSRLPGLRGFRARLLEVDPDHPRLFARGPGF